MFRCRHERRWTCPEGHENIIECWAYQRMFGVPGGDPLALKGDSGDTAFGLPESAAAAADGESDGDDSSSSKDLEAVLFRPCRCTYQCEKILPCGHRCKRLCGAPCPPPGCCPDCVAALKPKEVMQLLGLPLSEEEEEASAAAAAAGAGGDGSPKVIGGKGQPLTREHVKSLLLYVCQVPRSPTQELLLEPWRAAAERLREEDYFAFTQCDPLRDTTAERRSEVECAGGTVRYVIEALAIKMPQLYKDAPMCWLYLALASLLDAKVLQDVRLIYHDWLTQCVPSNVRYFVSRLPAEVGKGVRCLWTFLTVHKVACLEHFKTESMAKLAETIIGSLNAYRFAVLNSDMIRMGHKFDCMKGLVPCDTPIPPYGEVGKRELYLEANADKVFVSVDLRRADYALLLMACPDWVARCPSWESFVLTVLGEAKSRGGGPFYPHIEKLRMERTKLLGKLCHTKNVVLQSFVLCLIVRALLCAMVDDTCRIPAKCIYRFSCDELIIECRDRAAAKVVRDYVQKTIASSLPLLKPHTRVEAFVLHKFDLTEDMLRIIQEAADVSDAQKEDTPRNGCLEVYEGNIDEEWSEKHETKTEPKNDKIYFVRETLLCRDKTFAIKTVPKCVLTEVMPFVIQELVWKQKKDEDPLPAAAAEGDEDTGEPEVDEDSSESDDELAAANDCVDLGDSGEEQSPSKRGGGGRGGGNRGGNRGNRGGNRDGNRDGNRGGGNRGGSNRDGRDGNRDGRDSRGGRGGGNNRGGRRQK